jgi:hypothetical protein
LVVKTVETIAEIPANPGVYAMYGGFGPHRYVAYVGIADNLKRRISQHLVRRDSSVTTGVTAVSLNPDLVTEVEWWEHPDFRHHVRREAAEAVAFEMLDPVLRSRGRTQQLAEKLMQEDGVFVTAMRSMFAGAPTGRFVRPSLQAVLDRIAVMEQRLQMVERRLAKLGGDAPPQGGRSSRHGE